MTCMCSTVTEASTALRKENKSKTESQSEMASWRLVRHFEIDHKHIRLANDLNYLSYEPGTKPKEERSQIMPPSLPINEHQGTNNLQERKRAKRREESTN